MSDAYWISIAIEDVPSALFGDARAAVKAFLLEEQIHREFVGYGGTLRMRLAERLDGANVLFASASEYVLLHPRCRDVFRERLAAGVRERLGREVPVTLDLCAGWDERDAPSPWQVELALCACDSFKMWSVPPGEWEQRILERWERYNTWEQRAILAELWWTSGGSLPAAFWQQALCAPLASPDREGQHPYGLEWLDWAIPWQRVVLVPSALVALHGQRDQTEAAEGAARGLRRRSHPQERQRYDQLAALSLEDLARTIAHVDAGLPLEQAIERACRDPLGDALDRTCAQLPLARARTLAKRVPLVGYALLAALGRWDDIARIAALADEPLALAFAGERLSESGAGEALAEPLRRRALAQVREDDHPWEALLLLPLGQPALRDEAEALVAQWSGGAGLERAAALVLAQCAHSAPDGESAALADRARRMFERATEIPASPQELALEPLVCARLAQVARRQGDAVAWARWVEEMLARGSAATSGVGVREQVRGEVMAEVALELPSLEVLIRSERVWPELVVAATRDERSEADALFARCAHPCPDWVAWRCALAIGDDAARRRWIATHEPGVDALSEAYEDGRLSDDALRSVAYVRAWIDWREGRVAAGELLALYGRAVGSLDQLHDDYAWRLHPGVGRADPREPHDEAAVRAAVARALSAIAQDQGATRETRAARTAVNAALEAITEEASAGRGAAALEALAELDRAVAARGCDHYTLGRLARRGKGLAQAGMWHGKVALILALSGEVEEALDVLRRLVHRRAERADYYADVEVLAVLLDREHPSATVLLDEILARLVGDQAQRLAGALLWRTRRATSAERDRVERSSRALAEAEEARAARGQLLFG